MDRIDLTAGTLILTAVAAGLMAWRYANRQSALIKDMADWLAEHRPTAWSREPRLARRLFLFRAIDDLRRKGVADDPEFDRLFRTCERERRKTVAWVLVAAILIAFSILRI